MQTPTIDNIINALKVHISKDTRTFEFALNEINFVPDPDDDLLDMADSVEFFVYFSSPEVKVKVINTLLYLVRVVEFKEENKMVVKF